MSVNPTQTPGASVEDSGRHPAQQRQRREGRGSLELLKGTGFRDQRGYFIGNGVSCSGSFFRRRGRSSEITGLGLGTFQKGFGVVGPQGLRVLGFVGAGPGYQVHNHHHHHHHHHHHLDHDITSVLVVLLQLSLQVLVLLLQYQYCYSARLLVTW